VVFVSGTTGRPPLLVLPGELVVVSSDRDTLRVRQRNAILLNFAKAVQLVAEANLPQTILTGTLLPPGVRLPLVVVDGGTQKTLAQVLAGQAVVLDVVAKPCKDALGLGHHVLRVLLKRKGRIGLGEGGVRHWKNVFTK
jgi:hypothetical protein